MDHMGLYIEQTMTHLERACISRQPKTQAQWSKAMELWRSTFSESLGKLAVTAEQLEKDAEKKAVSENSNEPCQARYSRLLTIQNIKNASLSYAVEKLAGANDAKAAETCAIGLYSISDMTRQKDEMKTALEGARRLLQAEKLPAN